MLVITNKLLMISLFVFFLVSLEGLDLILNQGIIHNIGRFHVVVIFKWI